MSCGRVEGCWGRGSDEVTVKQLEDGAKGAHRKRGMHYGETLLKSLM